MKTYRCPFCGSTVACTRSTYRELTLDFNSSFQLSTTEESENSSFKINLYNCPTCNNVSILAKGVGSLVKDRVVFINPISAAKHFPTYIPEPIRNDYEEAYAILLISPKSSATLSRRCLQGIIRDYWKISKDSLFLEINALKDKIQPDLWQAIDAIRSIGNIGAHMQEDVNCIVDIDAHESERLLKLIELLFDEWYIARHNRELLLSDVKKIAESKK